MERWQVRNGLAWVSFQLSTERKVTPFPSVNVHVASVSAYLPCAEANCVSPPVVIVRLIAHPFSLRIRFRSKRRSKMLGNVLLSGMLRRSADLIPWMKMRSSRTTLTSNRVLYFLLESATTNGSRWELGIKRARSCLSPCSLPSWNWSNVSRTPILVVLHRSFCSPDGWNMSLIAYSAWLAWSTRQFYSCLNFSIRTTRLQKDRLETFRRPRK
jgi:hypothetical protein